MTRPSLLWPFLSICLWAQAAHAEMSPNVAVRAWNDALYAGDAATAERLTSLAGREYVRRAFGSFKELSNEYQNSPRGRSTVVGNSVEVRGDVAIVTYCVKYERGLPRVFRDVVVKEADGWRIAPQHVQAIEFGASQRPHLCEAANS